MIYELIILIFGWLYPAFATYNIDSQRSQVAWLKFWIVFGIFNAFHFFTACLEPFVPFLAGFKLCLLFWMLPTMGGGCHMIHDVLVEPTMRRNKETIQNTFDGMTTLSSTLLREVTKMIYHLLVDIVEQCWMLTRNADDIHVTPRLQSAINEVIAELRIARQAASSSRSDSDSAAEPHKEDLLDEEINLRILLAEAQSARRMQLALELASYEHMAPISNSIQTPLLPPKPRRGKRKVDTPIQLAQMEEVDRVYREHCGATKRHLNTHTHTHKTHA